MKHIHLKKHIVITGLIVIIFVLLSSTIGSFILIWQGNSEANKALHIQDLYEQAHYLARSEDGVADEYYLNPGLASREEYRTDAYALNTVLEEIGEEGDVYDQSLVGSLLNEQKLYTSRVLQFFHLVDTRVSQARAVYNEQADPLSADLNVRLQTELNEDHQETIQRLASFKRTEQVIIISLILLFICSILLLTIGLNMIRNYQRQLAQAREDEWEQMNRLARSDPLTGLSNHRETIEHLEREIASCRDFPIACALMFVDLDHFKQINDQWGHHVGDSVLCEASRRLQSHMRASDIVGRYGGEEFVIVLHGIDQAQAEQMAERLRVALADHPCLIPSEKEGEPCHELFLTASIGIAIFRQHGTTSTELLEAADNAMYQAKRSGRNRVCVASDIPSNIQHHREKNARISEGETMTLQALTAAAQTRDDGTSLHAHRLVKIAGAIAQRLQCSPEEVHLIELAALLHDIGKIGIPDAILHKPGPLTPDEWRVMRQHPVLGQQMLRQVGGIFEELARIVVAHHERWDGQGYPFGLSGQEIPLGARILAIVDSYDAMTSLRIYREPLSEEEARTELLRCVGSQFDPQIVTAFLEELDSEEVLEASKKAITA